MVSLKRLWGLCRKRPHSEAFPEDIRPHVRAAYALLCNANKRAIQVPSDIVTVITDARRAASTSSELDTSLEARFWNAYGLLSSSIRPAESARCLYRNVFYIVISVLLLAQFVFLTGDHIRTKLNALEQQNLLIAGRSSGNVPPEQGLPAETARLKQDQIRESQVAYHRLASVFVNVVSTPLRLAGIGIIVPEFSEQETGSHKIMRASCLEMVLIFLSGYLLPMLYGLLGSCAFVLRKLSDEIDKLTYANDTRVRYSLRLNVGLLCGLAVGWFIKPGSGDASLLSLSPLALAFVAGYGSELFFVALDKLVHAFAPPQGSTSKSVNEITAGGMTAKTTESKEVHVAGRHAPDGAEDRRSGAGLQAVPTGVEIPGGKAA